MTDLLVTIQFNLVGSIWVINGEPYKDGRPVWNVDWLWTEKGELGKLVSRDHFLGSGIADKEMSRLKVRANQSTRI